MKIAITGKGGVGKTTVAGTLARILAERGRRVYAVDADPDANLASAIGIEPGSADTITPISEMNLLIKERTGAEPGTQAPVFKMNPKVDDIPESFSIEAHGVRLLRMGTVKKGGAGCICPESSLLRSLLTHLLLNEKDVVIVDMEAGIEHLGRATARGVDAMLVIVEPGRRSVQTADSVIRLAGEIGVNSIGILANKTTGADEEFCRELAEKYNSMEKEGARFLGCLPFNDDVRNADLKGASAFDAAPSFTEAISGILDKLEAEIL